MAKTLFAAIGYRLGQKAAQAKNAFDLMGGTEEESLRAEIRLGRDLAAALRERTPLVQENETTRFAAQIGHWLGAHVKEKKLPFDQRISGQSVSMAGDYFAKCTRPWGSGSPICGPRRRVDPPDTPGRHLG